MPLSKSLMTISDTMLFSKQSIAIPAPPAKGSIYTPPVWPVFCINNLYRSGESGNGIKGSEAQYPGTYKEDDRQS